MTTVIIVWLLLVNPDLNTGKVVPGISSETECNRLGKELTKGWLDTYKCKSYEARIG